MSIVTVCDMNISVTSLCDKVTGSPNFTIVGYLHSWFGRNKFWLELVKIKMQYFPYTNSIDPKLRILKNVWETSSRLCSSFRSLYQRTHLSEILSGHPVRSSSLPNQQPLISLPYFGALTIHMYICTHICMWYCMCIYPLLRFKFCNSRVIFPALLYSLLHPQSYNSVWHIVNSQ